MNISKGIDYRWLNFMLTYRYRKFSKFNFEHKFCSGTYPIIIEDDSDEFFNNVK